MSEFKPNYKTQKKSHLNDRKKRRGNIKHWLIYFNIVIIVGVIILTILYLAKETNPCKDTAINAQKSDKEITYDYVDNFYGIYKSLFYKLYHAEDDNFLDTIKEYADKHYFKTVMSYELIHKYAERIDEMITEGERKTSISGYYNTFNEYAKLIRHAYLSFETNELHTQEKVEYFNPENIKNIKLGYQQLHIYTILSHSLKILERYKIIIVEILKKKLKTKSFLEISKTLLNKFEQTKNKMLTLNDYDLDLKHKEKKIDIKYLLLSFGQYKGFLLLNLYVIFLQIFEIDENFEPIKLEKEFLEEFRSTGEKTDKNKEDNRLKEFEDSAVKSCKKIFLLILKNDNTEEFFDINNEDFEVCKFTIFDHASIECM